ncbi:hypothetical protein [Halosolutus gelatinilyticus]|uniref:hypothetical protein n=1 Tax=Halosolutus gelatinilyticus TaxID=2931975 RepID=UPI001FF51AA8|nr:hypothetical protein [Halosolutus gelatinilyticus]
MKLQRSLAITLTVALFGGLLFMGAAGSAAAQVNINVGDIDQDADSNATTTVDVDQSNDNAQVGVSNANADAGAISVGNHGGHTKDKGAAPAFAGAEANSAVLQDQNVIQDNDADVTAVSFSNAENEIEFDITEGA